MEVMKKYAAMRTMCDAAEEIVISNMKERTEAYYNDIFADIGSVHHEGDLRKISLISPVVPLYAYRESDFLAETLGISKQLLYDIIHTKKAILYNHDKCDIIERQRYLELLSEGCKDIYIGARAIERMLDGEISDFVLYAVPVLPIVVELIKGTDDAFFSHRISVCTYRVCERNARIRRFIDRGAPSLIIFNEERMLQEAADKFFDSLVRHGVTFMN